MTRKRITLTEAAVADILKQAEWYETQAGRPLAERWEEAVTAALLRILQTPRSGCLCSFNSPRLQGVRRALVAGFPKHLVFYRPLDKELLVLRIVHGARDLESLF